MSMIEPGIALSLKNEIQKIEHGTDLKRVSVISRIGMKVATATSDEVDADAETASSSALIELSERLAQSVNNGNLREILIKANDGFIILLFINDEFMLFGGITNPLRVGFYLEYLRNAAHRFAYIIAGNQVTEQLRNEIEASKDRDFRLKEEAKAPVTANFKMDKDTSQDMQAMEGVLDFLKDWGGDEDEDEDQDQGQGQGKINTSPTKNNIIGIDQDMMFGMDDLVPKPITDQNINEAQNSVSAMNEETSTNFRTPPKEPSITGKEAEEENMDDILAALDEISEATTETKAPETIAQEISEVKESEEEGGFPDDILAALDGFEDTKSDTDLNTRKKSKTKPDLPYGVPIYEDEVPTVPLDDYISFEIGSLTGKTEEPTGDLIEEVSILDKKEADPFTSEISYKDDGTPDFDAISTEYDVDLDLEEDAMLEALEELNLVPDKKKS